MNLSLRNNIWWSSWSLKARHSFVKERILPCNIQGSSNIWITTKNEWTSSNSKQILCQNLFQVFLLCPWWLLWYYWNCTLVNDWVIIWFPEFPMSLWPWYKLASSRYLKMVGLYLTVKIPCVKLIGYLISSFTMGRYKLTSISLKQLLSF
jgi:hypothetical protein